MKIDMQKAEYYFSEAKKIFDRDNGKLWGINFNGPMMFVHPESRDIVTNQQDPEKELKKKGNVFVGKASKQFNPANCAMNWNGTKWTTVLWYEIGTRQKDMLKTLAHETFHRIQDQLWFEKKHTPVLSHLEKYDGRVWFKLELNEGYKITYNKEYDIYEIIHN